MRAAWLLPALALFPACAAVAGPERDALTGNWGGLRDRMEAKGLAVEAFLLADANRVQRGGLRPRRNAVRTWLEVRAVLDLEKAAGLEGTTVTGAFWRIGGRNGSRNVGAFDEVSPYESDGRREFAELFAEWTRDAWRAKAGKMDATADFTTSEVTGDFLNLGAGFAPNLLGIPVYPDPAAGGALFYEPEEGFRAGAGLYDGALQAGERTGIQGPGTLFGAPSDLYGIVEAGWRGRVAGREVRAAAGRWVHTGEFPSFDGGSRHGTRGLYAGLEGTVWRPDGAEEGDARGLALALRAATADERVAAVERHLVVAAVWTGPLRGRPDDSLGLSWTVADLSDRKGAGFGRPAERVGEAYYRVPVTPYLALTPDVQVLLDPGGRSRNALVLGLRLVLDF